MAQVAAEYKAPIILMHNQRTTEYARDIIAEILDFLNKSMEIALKAGVAKSQLIIDPGIGFGKDAQQNLAVLARMAELKALGCPILLGTSRKRFIGHILGGLPPEERGEGTAATVALGIANQANIVRVHDVKQMVQVARITDAILGGVAHD
jgi:dihydropteroate synthase